MVSGTLFHCRKNSWPPEEYITKATLQLFDFDSAAPPSQAWRRKLNSHASKLKEFSVTFTEAIKMVRLGIRLWSYVREEASYGRRAPIDPFTRERCKPSASHGVPLGGMGSGSISRGFRGEFKHFQILPGTCETSPVMANQFLIFISRDGGNKKYASVLSLGEPEGLGKTSDHGISSWGWNLSGQHSTYHALFRRAWTVYDGEPDPELKVSCRQISPFIPHDYSESSLPTSVFVYTVLASNMIFLGVVIFVPFTLGRIILYYLSWLLSSASNPVLSTVMPFTETALSLANITLKSAWTAVENLTPTANEESSLVGQVTEMLKANVTGLSEAANNLSSTVSTDLLKGSSIGTSRLSDVTTLAVGYMFIFSLVFFYLGIVALIRYTRGEPLTLGKFYGIASIAETIPSLFRQFVAAMRHLMTMIKVAFLLVIELGVFPLMCGWWLDVCTIRMFGKSITQRVEFFSVSPLASSLVHWVVGIVYMLQISIFVSLLRGVLRNGVLYFLRDPADPNYNPFRDLIDDPVHKHARRVLLSVAVYGSLIVMLVYLPVKLAMRMAPSIFPLDISVSDPFTEIPADMLLFQICIPFAIEHFKLRTTIKSLLRYWFTAVGWGLGLTDFLLPRPEDNNGGQENGNGDQGRQDRFQAPHGVQDRALIGFAPDNRARHATAGPNFVEDYEAEEQANPDRYAFVLRIVLLLVVAWMTLLLFNSALIIVPISLGRALFNSLPLLPITHGIKCNDLYAFVIGSYAIWTAIAGARYSIDQIRTRRVAALMNQIWKWCVIVLKSSALLSIWIVIIPVLIGLLFELLVIVPMRVPIDESPVFLLYQDWALGLIFLKIWTRLVMLDHMMPLVDESWRLKFERVRENGFSRLQGFWVLREIVLPIIMKLLTALCVPYVLARGVFPILGYPLLVNSAVYRFAWLGCLGFSLFCFCAKRFHLWFTNLHNSIRDDRYLIGRRLHNFGEVLQRQNEVEVAREGEIPVLAGGDVQEVADVGLRHRRGIMQDA